jgi:hypothetical protein
LRGTNKLLTIRSCCKLYKECSMHSRSTRHVFIYNSTPPFIGLGLGLWYVMPLSTIFQIYHGGKFYYHIMLYTSPWAGFKLRTLVVIGTDCTGSCKFNYHTIMTTMALLFYKVTSIIHIYFEMGNKKSISFISIKDGYR